MNIRVLAGITILGAGDIPTVEMSFSAGESAASFTVTGYLIDLNQ